MKTNNNTIKQIPNFIILWYSSLRKQNPLTNCSVTLSEATSSTACSSTSVGSACTSVGSAWNISVSIPP